LLTGLPKKLATLVRKRPSLIKCENSRKITQIFARNFDQRISVMLWIDHKRLFATAITPQCRQPNLRVSDFAVSNLIFAVIREREKTKSERDSLRA
jgi:hypothetical protein